MYCTCVLNVFNIHYALHWAMVFFSMPPSFKYTVKATGEQFRSHEEDHYKAYVEYLRSKL